MPMFRFYENKNCINTIEAIFRQIYDKSNFNTTYDIIRNTYYQTNFYKDKEHKHTAGLFFFTSNSNVQTNSFTGMKFYCFNCKSFSNYVLDLDCKEKTTYDNVVFKEFTVKKVYCKNCGTEHVIGEKEIFLLNNHFSESFKANSTIFNDEDKLKLSTIEWIFENRNGNVIFKKILYGLVVNFKTGRTHYYVKDMNTKKTISIVDVTNSFLSNASGKIYDYLKHTVADDNIVEEFYRLLYKRVYDLYENKNVFKQVDYVYNLKDADFDSRKNEFSTYIDYPLSTAIEYLIALNKYANYNVDDFSKLFTLVIYRKAIRKRFNDFDASAFSVNINRILVKANKPIKKIVYNEPYKIWAYMLLKRFFKNNDVLVNILSLNYKALFALFISIFRGCYSENDADRESAYDRMFALNYMIKVLGEASVWNKIKAHMFKGISKDYFEKVQIIDLRCYDILKDCLNYASLCIKLSKDFDIALPKNIFVGNIDEIHNKCRLFYKKARHQNANIKYNEKEMLLEDNICGYEFKLPRETAKLVEVGEYMHICVGDLYTMPAVRKECNIIYIVKDNKYVGCIELRPTTINGIRTYKVCQAKGHRNSLPQGDLKSVMLAWINKKGLIINTRDIDDKDEFEYAIAF